jgi:glycosyltransferase involved in cell wall biosynthesis
MKLSIITVGYGDYAGLVKTIESVDGQLEPWFQHIIVASNIHEIEEIKNNYEKDKRIFVVDEDTSLYNAMNVGMTLASGDAIIYLNSGDVFFNGYIVGLIGQNFVQGKCLIGRTIQTYRDLHFVRPGLKRLEDLRIYPGHQGFVAPLPENIFDRILYDESNRIGADSVWMQENLRRFECVLIPDCIARFALGGISNSPSLSAIKQRFESKQPLATIKTLIKIILAIILGQRNHYKVIAKIRGYEEYNGNDLV